VIELPASVDAQDNAAAILTAVLRSQEGEFEVCPIVVPMYPDAKLAVTGLQGLVLLGVVGRDLCGLRAITQAYGWLRQNHSLIIMALPQMAIDPAQLPRLRLFVDHADRDADLLGPLLQQPHVSVQAYRLLRWGDRRGILLEAA